MVSEGADDKADQRIAWISGMVKSRTARTGFPEFCSICLTMAEPTIMPSAAEATSAACWGVEMPKPMHTGVEVCCLIAAT